MFKLYFVAKGEIPDLLMKIIKYGLNGYLLSLLLSFIYKFYFLFVQTLCLLQCISVNKSMLNFHWTVPAFLLFN